MSEPVVSVVVAARNAAATIDACLAALAAQTFTAHEVIVVDDGSTDDTASRARTADVQVLDAAGRGASAARNRGVQHARGRYVAFTDADCEPPPHWLMRLVETLDATGATGAGGGQRNVFPPDVRDARAFDAFFRLASIVSDYTRSGGHDVRPVPHNASCNSAYRRDALLAAGGFAEGFWPGEDVDLDLRLRAAGGRLLFVPGIEVRHHRPGHLRWFRQMMRRYGAAEREIVRRHGRKRRIDYLPPLLGAGVAVHLLYLVPACRPWLLVADTGVIIAAALALVVTTPPRHWLDVIVFSTVAVWEWLRGWREGKRTRGSED